MGRLPGGSIIAGPSNIAAAADRLAAAHRALRADPDIQFRLQRAAPPPQPPAWLRSFGHWLRDALAPIGRLMRKIGSLMPDAPYARIFLWSVLALAAAGLIWLILTRLREGEWRLPRWRRSRGPAVEAEEGEEGWRPDAAPAKAWLEEADALAAQGLYADAAHHLLLSSIEDMARRRPGLIKPALTSRDLTRATAIPHRARLLFADMAALVERSLFGRRALVADDWSAMRAAYADFIRPPAWQKAR